MEIKKIFLSFVFFVTLCISKSLCAQPINYDTANFSKADSIAALYPHYSLRDLKSLSDKLTIPLSTEEEKFRVIYLWVCRNIENDYQYYTVNKREREKLYDKPEELKKWNKKFSVLVFNRLLKDQKTVCSGYAYLIKELAYHAGLNCVIVDGYGRTAQSNIGGPGILNHSWNAIQLHGNWYLCDATWSSGSIDPLRHLFIKKFDEGYFLSDPTLFVRNHYPADSAWMLLQDKPTLHEFLNRPLVYGSIHNYKVIPIDPETFEVSTEKGETLSFLFKSLNGLLNQKVELQINGSSYSSELKEVENGLYQIDHIFSTKGKFVVHVLIDSSYVFSYSVSVK